jgi:hypothetical protein
MVGLLNWCTALKYELHVLFVLFLLFELAEQLKLLIVFSAGDYLPISESVEAVMMPRTWV